MLFTIIVPVYNKEKYLRRCLDSVVNQTSKNFECLLIDDGSTDGSNEICREYEEKYKFFKLYKKENGGLSDARNYGIERAYGEYILFLDADDCFDRNLVCVCSRVFEKYNVDIVAFGMYAVTEKTYVNLKNEVPQIRENSDLIFDILKSSTGCSVCNKAYRKEIFNNLKFIKGKLFEDQFIIFKLLKGGKIIVLNNTMYFYFQDIESSLSKMKIYSETYDYLESAIEFTKDLEYSKDYLKLAAQTVYERIILLLTNVYYCEGQFRYCNRKKIDNIIKRNIMLIKRGLPTSKRLMLMFYLYMPDIVGNMLIRMRFRPIVYLKGKLKWKK